MPTTNTMPVLSEYEAQRQYLASAKIGIAELVEKTMQMLVYITENHIGKESVDE